MQDDDGFRYHDAVGLDRAATEWSDGTVYARPVSEAEHRSNPFPRYRLPPPRDPVNDQIERAVAWWQGTDWRRRELPPLPQWERPEPPSPEESEDESDVALD